MSVEYIHMTMNRGWISITIPYSSQEVKFFKSLTGSWWHSKYKTWNIRAVPSNIEAIQQRYGVLSKGDYEKWILLARQSADPIIVEIYETPEHPESIAVKIKGHGADLSVIKEMPERSYQKEMKRWILKHNPDIIDRIIAFYTAKGAKIINRVTTACNNSKPTLTFKERQKHLISRYPKEYHEVLNEYINPMIQMRYSWNTVSQYTHAFMKYVTYLGSKKAKDADVKVVNQYLVTLARENVSESLVHTAVNAIKFYYVKVKFLPDFAVAQIKRPTKSKTLPSILSIAEVDRLLRSVDNLKHVAILYSLYSAGLRLSELLNLKITDILNIHRIREFMVERMRFIQGAKHRHSRSYGAYLQRRRKRILSAENLKFYVC